MRTHTAHAHKASPALPEGQVRPPVPRPRVPLVRSRQSLVGCKHVCRAVQNQRGTPAQRVTVIGGGWAGYGAARALLQAGVPVTVLDASEEPGGLAATSVKGGRKVEPGIKGFWAQYTNIFKLVDELGLKDPFTDWTSSAFYSPQGLEVKSPVLQSLPRLPTPLGSFIYTNPYFTRLPIADRLTALPLVIALLEYNIDEETYRRYDSISAFELFRSAGISRKLFEFLESMLLVILFAPAVQLSAAAALDALYFFVLAHQQDFDVRWCRGPVGQTLLQPLKDDTERNGAEVKSGRRVKQVAVENPSSSTSFRVTTSTAAGIEETWDSDAVILAVGVRALQGIVSTSPDLAQVLAGTMNLGTIDAIAVRLFLGQRVIPEYPSNVLAGFERGVGATLFDLNALQDTYKDEPNSVLEVDFYGASSLLPLSDEQLIARIIRHLSAVNKDYSDAVVIDSSVVRVRQAITSFSPGSHSSLPPTVTGLPGLFCAGDCVRQGPGSHPAKGLCQEKAFVTGLKAGNAAAETLGNVPKASVLEPEEDEEHIKAGREALRALRAASAFLHRPGHSRWSSEDRMDCQNTALGPLLP